MTTTANDNDGDDFFRELLDYIFKGRNIPKFQIERAAGPILGLFIEEVMSVLLKCPVDLLAAEFPLRKKGKTKGGKASNLSMNVDWLLYDKQEKELYFLELKTDRSSFSKAQLSTYQKWAELESDVWGTLQRDLDAIEKASKKGDKYKAYRGALDEIIKNPSIGFDPKGIKRIKLVYLAPDKCVPKWESKLNIVAYDSFDFSQMPAAVKRYNPYWMALRKRLCEL